MSNLYVEVLFDFILEVSDAKNSLEYVQVICRGHVELYKHSDLLNKIKSLINFLSHWYNQELCWVFLFIYLFILIEVL